MAWTPPLLDRRMGYGYFPGGVAIGGACAGRVLHSTPGPVQRVAIQGPLPRVSAHFTGMFGQSQLEVTTEVYEFCDLRIGEHAFIPYWKLHGMSDEEALQELFRGYHDGKEAEAGER